MSINDFVTHQNVNMIWEILLDEDALNNRSEEIINDISNVVKQNIKGFYENERKQQTTLIELNKKFITLIINYVKKTYPLQTQQKSKETYKQPIIQQPKQTQNDLVTYSDIQTERISQFEKDLTRRQSEFTNAMALPVPEKPNFSDKLDEPMSEMEIALKNAISQRNYDIEQVSKNISINKNNDSWLKGAETSIKNEKLSPPPSLNNNVTKSNQNNQNTQNNLKYIKIDNKPIENNILKKDIIDLNQNNQTKHISWADENINIKINMTELEIDKDTDTEINNIFKKLKVIPQQSNVKELDNVITKEVSNNNDKDRINNLELKLNDLINKVDKLIEHFTTVNNSNSNSINGIN